jgi:type II secretory pathway pseudopilin PulG
MRTFTNPAVLKRRPLQSGLSRKMAGFIQGILLFGIALLAVVIAAFAFSNKSSSNSTKAEEAKTYASTIMAQGNTIKTAVERFRLDRGGLLNGNSTGGLENLMDFSTDQFKGLHNTLDSFAVPLTVQPRAYTNLQVQNTAPPTTTAAGSYNLRIYHGTATSPMTVGGQPVYHLLSTAGLTDDTCRRINVNLHGAGFSQGAIPTGAGVVGNRADFNAGISTATTGTISITMTDPSGSGTPINNLEEGCIKTAETPAVNVYFKVLNRIAQ